MRIQYVILFWLFVIATGCLTEKRRLEVTNDYLNRNPEFKDETCARAYVGNKDSVVYVTGQTDTIVDLQVIYDTIYRAFPELVNLPIRL